MIMKNLSHAGGVDTAIPVAHWSDDVHVVNL